MLGQRSEHDGLVAVWAELSPAATVVLMDLCLTEAHGQLTELTRNGAVPAFRGLMKLQRVLRHALLTHCTPDLLVPALAMLFHLRLEDGSLALGAEGQEEQAVGLVEGQVGGGQASFAVPAHLEGSLHFWALESSC